MHLNPRCFVDDWFHLLISSWPIGLPFHFLLVLNALLAKLLEHMMKILDWKKTSAIAFPLHLFCSFQFFIRSHLSFIMSILDSAAQLRSRAHELGLSQTAIDSLKTAGISTLGHLAFAGRCQPYWNDPRWHSELCRFLGSHRWGEIHPQTAHLWSTNIIRCFFESPGPVFRWWIQRPSKEVTSYWASESHWGSTWTPSGHFDPWRNWTKLWTYWPVLRHDWRKSHQIYTSS